MQNIYRGSVSMVDVGKHSGASQFFIHLDDNSMMKGSSVVFGMLLPSSILKNVSCLIHAMLSLCNVSKESF